MNNAQETLIDAGVDADTIEAYEYSELVDVPQLLDRGDDGGCKVFVQNNRIWNGWLNDAFWNLEHSTEAYRKAFVSWAEDCGYTVDDTMGDLDIPNDTIELDRLLDRAYGEAFTGWDETVGDFRPGYQPDQEPEIFNQEEKQKFEAFLETIDTMDAHFPNYTLGELDLSNEY